jgi:conjugative transfer signal peptidase TraF
MVLVCLPMPIATLAHRRGYVPRGGRCPNSLVPIGKIVVAVSGDTVSVSAAGVIVNGALKPCSRPVERDLAGRPMPRLPVGARVLGPDSVWLLAPSERSFDSRYVGAVRRVDIVTRIRPVWVWTDTMRCCCVGR